MVIDGTTQEGQQILRSRLSCQLTSEGDKSSCEDNNVIMLPREDGLKAE